MHQHRCGAPGFPHIPPTSFGQQRRTAVAPRPTASPLHRRERHALSCYTNARAPAHAPKPPASPQTHAGTTREEIRRADQPWVSPSPASGSACSARRRCAYLWSDSMVTFGVEIKQCVGCTRNRHRHAIEQASRRWRGGRRDDSTRTRRKILISTQRRARPPSSTSSS